MSLLPVSRPAARAVLFVACVVAACEGRGLKAVLEPETGEGMVYVLQTFNGKPVPAEIVSGETKLEIKKGALTLGTDSGWIISYVVRQATAGGESNTVNSATGFFSLSGTTIKLRNIGDTVTRLLGTYSTTDVSLTDITVPNGDRLVFKR